MQTGAILRAVVVAYMLSIGAYNAYCDDSGSPEATEDGLSRLYDAAMSNFREGEYSRANSKCTWMFINGQRYGSDADYTRLGPALALWVKLASVYPPAKESISELRGSLSDKLLKGSLEPDDAEDAFRDLLHLNRAIGLESNTLKTFRDLDARHESTARAVYPMVQNTLVAEGEYATCAKYLSVEDAASMAVKKYKTIVEVAGYEYVLAEIAERMKAEANEELKSDVQNIIDIIRKGGMAKPGDLMAKVASVINKDLDTHSFEIKDGVLMGGSKGLPSAAELE
ncbi:hypothetical protein Mal64_32340 [Pseudobythopirellula maris]|uniref:Uncharacterized protein n=2 Tax=Pseudobythopirellula maris TaxID=2527991 RepID=A0A5C5ZLI6_9BACT|nr:hypothetical protein Mal64_32340 [Pseudobythopirellula maris]